MATTLPARLSSKVFETVADGVGKRNPQLLREWQGRLRWRNLLITLVLSFLVQGLAVLQRLGQVPTDRFDGAVRYCLQHETSGCLLDANQKPKIDWIFVFADIFQDLSFVLVFGLIVAGVYLLGADLSKETRRGTLNFLRMSPLPGRQILLGKLLGVPVLLYLGMAAVLPLHFAMGRLGSYPVGLMLMFYGLLGAVAFCFYAAALWMSLLASGLQGLQTWIMAALSAGVLIVSWNLEYLGFSVDWFHLFNPLHLLARHTVVGLNDQLELPFGNQAGDFHELGWLFLKVGQSYGGLFCLALINALALGLWFWAVLERKFQTPTKAALGKQQSYALTFWLAVTMLGLAMQWLPDSEYKKGSIEVFWDYPIVMLIWSVVLLFLLLPSRQVLLDWLRYRHHQQGNRTAHLSNEVHAAVPRKQSIVTDLLFNDAAPSVVAYGVNLAIIAGVLCIGMIVCFSVGLDHVFSPVVADWFYCSAFLLVCAILLQLVALSNLLHWRWVAFGTVAAMVAGWPIMLAMMGVSEYGSGFDQHLWLFSAFPKAVIHHASWHGVMAANLGYLVMITGLGAVLTRRCRVLGRSEWKALEGSRPRLG